jgi:hypothetical protein
MRYLWIFLGCYAVAFAIINLRMAAQRANMNAHFKNIGGSPEQLQANIRAAMPLPKEIFIRLWAPFIFSLVPAALISFTYFIFS